MNILWLKRDLRDTDHGPLAQALKKGPTIALFLIEPEWFGSEEFSERHLRFAMESLKDLEPRLIRRGVPLLIKNDQAKQVFSSLLNEFPITAVFSHEETGSDWTYRRDRQMKKWFQEKSIPWYELPQFGVRRGSFPRAEWPSIRKKLIERPLIEVGGQDCPRGFVSDPLPWHLLKSPASSELELQGGKTKGLEIFNSFLFNRSKSYLGGISSPELAQESSSHLSPYLCWGNLSVTEVHQGLQKRLQVLGQEGTVNSRYWLRSLNGFESRLWWHCHFIQKLETEPEIEFHNFNRRFDGMREQDFREDYFQAWCRGETGFPMIDACMKALLREGWINFRMRAMLMSFSSYQLWLHWRKPAQHLARLFIDFEPGIHWSQVQMQSGVTGINTIRIYSPSKQAREQDPTGAFIRRNLPALDKLSEADLFEPHKMPPFLSMISDFKIGRDYPDPIVDPDDSFRLAKERIFKWKQRPEVAKASRAVFDKHGSRGKLKSPIRMAEPKEMK